MADSLLAIRNLNVRYGAQILCDVTIEVARGQSIGLVGESGSGKTQTMLAALGLLGPGARASGSIRYAGQEILGAGEARLNRLRGAKIAMIFQEPMTSLDPLFPVGAQIGQVLQRHSGLSRSAAKARAIELLELVGISDPALRMRAYPHEFSGGQRQRVMIAMAIANNPELIIADEPTTALDVTVQSQILDLLADLQKRLGLALVFISHDLRLVRRMATRLYVLRKGEVIESGLTHEVLAQPQTAYTRALIEAEPSGGKAASAADAAMLYEAKSVSVSFALPAGPFARAIALRAVDDVSFALRRGQTLGVVGESGSGKSTLARALLRLTPSSGDLIFNGANLQRLGGRALRALRRNMQMIFQDPFGSLSPRMNAGEIIGEGLLAHEPAMSAKARDAAAAQALAAVGLDPAMRSRTPSEFSGGQRQRIAIARALILRPQLLILDEPTSALDRTVQKDILALLLALQQAHGLTYIFISHDLSVIRAMADDVLVMRQGRIVEQGSRQAIFETPAQDYTRRLIAAAGLAPAAPL